MANMIAFICSLLLALGSTLVFARMCKQKLAAKNITGVYSAPMIFFYSLVTSGALYGIWYGAVNGYSFASLALALFFAVFTGLGISLGLHRHDTHKSFKAHPAVLCILSIGAWMGGMKKETWVPNHNLHHAKEDTFYDPHTPYLFNQAGNWWGFWWSHVGWLFVQRTDLDVLKQTDISKIPFIQAERYLFFPCLMLGFLIPAALFGWEGLWISFLRMFYVLHITFSINSAGHLFGTQLPGKSKSRNGTWLGALCTMIGERYHANHHADQRCAFLGWQWFDVDAGKWLLRILEKLGLAYDVRKPVSETEPPLPLAA